MEIITRTSREIVDATIPKEYQEEIIRCYDCLEHEPSGLCKQWTCGEADVYTDTLGYCYMAEKRVD